MSHKAKAAANVPLICNKEPLGHVALEFCEKRALGNAVLCHYRNRGQGFTVQCHFDQADNLPRPEAAR